MPSHRTLIAALLVALPTAALAQDGTVAEDETAEVGQITTAADASREASATNAIIDEIAEALSPVRAEPERGAAYMQNVREVEAIVRPGILMQAEFDAEAERLAVTFELNYNHARDFDVPFTQSGYMLSTEARAVVDELAAALGAPELSEERYLIAGHVDAMGVDALEAWLSERRAAEVRAYLVEEHGIDPAMLLTAGFGGKMPRVQGAGADNDRIEVVLVEEVGEPRPVVDTVVVVTEEEVVTGRRGVVPTPADGNVVCDSAPVALEDPRAARHNLDDFGSPRTPVECQDVHVTRD